MVLGIWRILATIIFMYLLWRNLKDDYRDPELVVFGWGLVLSFLAGGRVVYGLLNWGIWNDNWLDWVSVWTRVGFDYYGGYLAAALYTLAAANKYEWKLWNFAEDITKIFLIYVLLLLTGELIAGGVVVEAFTRIVVILSTIIAVNMVEGKYRSFAWYYSGRKGFVFFWGNIWYATVSLLISLWLNEALMLKVIYLLWCLISMFGLFILGEVSVPLKVKLKIKK